MNRGFRGYRRLGSLALALVACGGVSEPEAGPEVLPEASSDGLADRGGGGDTNGSSALPEPSAWSVRTAALDTGGSLDQVSLMLDRDGVPHIAYSQQGDLWHAWLQDGELANEQVDEFGRGWHKAWVAGSPELRLVYSSFAFEKVVFQAVRAPDGSWFPESDLLSDYGAAVNAVWSDGRAKLARLSSTGYSSDSPVLQGVVFDGVSPDATIRPTREEALGGLALALDRRGTAHIVYASPSDDPGLGVFDGSVPKTSEYPAHTVRYVSVRDGRWSEPETLSLGAGRYSGLGVAIDAEDRLHVIFSGPSEPAALLEEAVRGVSITHLQQDPGAPWHREVVPSTGTPRLAPGSLALDAEGEVHLVYQAVRDERPDLVHVQKVGDSWSAETIQEGPCLSYGTGANLALGADGSVHTAFQGCDRQLIYATRAAF